MTIMPRQQSRQPALILAVFTIVMAFLGYEMMEFRRAGKQLRFVEVHVVPDRVALKSGGTQTFTATVSGSENNDVKWSVQEGAAGGTVSANGSYTAPNVSGTFHVMARSAADPTRAGTATITVAQ